MTLLQIWRLQSSRNIQGYIPILHQFQKNIFSALGRFRMNRLNGNVYIPLNSRIHAEQQNSDNYEFLYYLYLEVIEILCKKLSCLIYFDGWPHFLIALPLSLTNLINNYR